MKLSPGDLTIKTPIINVLIGKEREKVNTETPTSIIIKEEKKIQLIKRIKKVMQSEELDISKYGYVCSLTVFEDKRIVIGDGDGNISISSYDITKKKLKKNIYKKKAHFANVNSLCALNGNRLLSGSSDESVKIWSVSKGNIKLIKTIQEHTDTINKVIPLSEGRFASCSWDNTVKIWKDDNTYKCLSTLTHNDSVNTILQLRGKEVLVSSTSSEIYFWDINSYTQQGSIKRDNIRLSNKMIELPNGNVALVSCKESCTLFIIDSSSYQIVTMIQLKNYFTEEPNLCSFNDRSFVYADSRNFLQISSEDY